MDSGNNGETRHGIAARLIAAVQVAAVLLIIGFGTWQFFQGNLEAGFSTLPFLVIWYFFLVYGKRK